MKKQPTVNEQVVRLLIGAQLNLQLGPDNKDVVQSATDLIAQAISLLNPPRVIPTNKKK